MNTKISELPLGVAEQNAVVPATNAAGNQTTKIKLIDVAGLANKSTVGLSNVDNTSDADKPISNMTQTALDGKSGTGHIHGNITPAGAIGSNSNLPIITTTDGVLTTGSFGNTANTFCQGNDSRLSNARTPTQHTHTTSEITDFSLGDATDNQYLQYNASQNLWKPTSSGSFSDIFVNNPNSVGTFTMKNETTSPGPTLQLNVHANNGASPFNASLPRLTARKSRGTENSPAAMNDNEPLLSIRTENIGFDGGYSLSARIAAWSDGVVSAENIYQPTRLELSTSSGGVALNNTLSLDSNGKLSWNGHVVIDDGLAAPTPVHDLGNVSGNVSISYSVDKQIQLLTLTGSSTNFILGENWPIVNKSVDILLEITVTLTTSVLWGLVDEWYNAAPAFISDNKYIVLLRSVGNTIQGHYIGKKTA